MTDLESSLAQLPPSLAQDVASHWHDFRTACTPLAIDAELNQPRLQQLAQVWAGSEFVARACIRDPELLLELINSGDLDCDYTDNGFSTRLQEKLTGIENEVALGIALRRFRRREMVRIAWRDLTNLAPLSIILAELSALADAAIDQALTKIHQWHCLRSGTPRDSNGQAQHLVVLGMGKLGGRELNFSSDIDLIFAYPQRGQTDGSRSLDNEQFFRNIAQSLIKALHEITAEGFVFRVDTRLRPFGESGPLVMPFNALEEYYQSHGRDWERYAMIKARIVAGDHAAGEQLLDLLRPFAYRRYLDYGAIESLRAMKALIGREVERKGLQRDVKLGPGGIREIEFIGQAFQLIYGGRERELRQREILSVLDYLAASERLPTSAVNDLKNAYEFLRRSENRLQAWADQQTHNLPTDETAKLRLAFVMGFADWSAYVAELKTHVSNVQEQFALVFANGQTDTATNFSTLWEEGFSTDSCIDYLRKLGFDEPEQTSKHLADLRASFSYRTLSQQGRDRLQQLLPLVLNEVALTQHPSTTLERIVRMLTAIAGRSVYLALLLESTVARSQWIKLCAASPWIAAYLSRYPLLLDDLLDANTLYQPLDRQHLQWQLDQALARSDPNDEEQKIDALRHFKQSNVLRVAAADISGAMPLMIVSDHLTEIAEVLLTHILQLAWMDVIPRFGRPQCLIDGQDYSPGLAIIAYGKLGGIELGYGSDLDLVFLHDSHGQQQWTDGDKQIDNAAFFAKLAQRIIHYLSAHTAAGVLYEVDTRLRPSGRSGLLVSSFTAFNEYQKQQAWTWEHQAIVRARFITGPTTLAEGFQALRREILSQTRDPNELRQQVQDMRERMRTELDTKQAGAFHLKQGRGGIADIEFIVQYLVLAHAHTHPQLSVYSDNIRQLDALEQSGILTTTKAHLLRDSYRRLRRRSHRLKLQEQSSLIDNTEFSPEREAISQLWHELLEPQ